MGLSLPWQLISINYPIPGLLFEQIQNKNDLRYASKAYRFIGSSVVTFNVSVVDLATNS